MILHRDAEGRIETHTTMNLRHHDAKITSATMPGRTTLSGGQEIGMATMMIVTTDDLLLAAAIETAAGTGIGTGTEVMTAATAQMSTESDLGMITIEGIAVIGIAKIATEIETETETEIEIETVIETEIADERSLGLVMMTTITTGEIVVGIGIATVIATAKVNPSQVLI